MKRGDIWWARLGPPAGDRPVVLLSRDAAYGTRELITIAPLTTRIRNLKSEVPLGRSEGLKKKCVASLDTITTIPKAVLDKKVTSLPRSKIHEIDRAIRFALGISSA